MARKPALSSTASGKPDVAQTESFARSISLHELPGHLIRRLDSRAASLYETFTGQSDLTPRQFGVLLTLFQAGALPQTELGNRLHLDRSTLGEMLQRMVERKLVERWFNTMQDITASKQAEQRIRRLSRVHAMLSGINSLIVRVRNRDDLYREAERLDVTPGWVSRDRPIFWKEPRTDFVPMHWDYKQVKDTLASAGALIDVALAERRNLILRNSFPNNNFATVKTLVCAYQMLLPGEVAPSHRHSAHAMRVILDAKGSYSIVDGEKTPMESGDIVLTPGGHWHGHGHEGAEPAYWLDGLDIPSVHLMEPMFFEEHPDKYEKITSVAASSRFRFSRDSILTRLDSAKGDPAGAHGPRVTLEAPDMPTMGLTVEKLGTGSQTRRHRSTANRIFVVMEGAGQTRVGEETFVWRRGDTVVVPTWTDFHHQTTSDSLLFCLSDEPLMRALKYYRSEYL